MGGDKKKKEEEGGEDDGLTDKEKKEEKKKEKKETKALKSSTDKSPKSGKKEKKKKNLSMILLNKKERRESVDSNAGNDVGIPKSKERKKSSILVRKLGKESKSEEELPKRSDLRPLSEDLVRHHLEGISQRSLVGMLADELRDHNNTLAKVSMQRKEIKDLQAKLAEYEVGYDEYAGYEEEGYEEGYEEGAYGEGGGEGGGEGEGDKAAEGEDGSSWARAVPGTEKTVAEEKEEKEEGEKQEEDKGEEDEDEKHDDDKEKDDKEKDDKEKEGKEKSEDGDESTDDDADESGDESSEEGISLPPSPRSRKDAEEEEGNGEEGQGKEEGEEDKKEEEEEEGEGDGKGKSPEDAPATPSRSRPAARPPRAAAPPPSFARKLPTSVDRSGKELDAVPEDILSNLELKKLVLARNKLSTMPEEAGKLTDLKELDLRYNQFSEIPECVKGLISLQTLIMNGNRLETFSALQDGEGLLSVELAHCHMKEVPQEIMTIPTLNSLKLFRNDLTSVPASIDVLSHLVSLDLEDNQLKEVPDSICNLQYLRHLYLKNNQLTKLPEQLFELSELYELDVSDNPDLKALPKMGASGYSLGIVKATDCGLTSFASLFHAPEEAMVLERLHLSRNRITLKKEDGYPEAMWSYLVHLQVLDLRENEITTIPDPEWLVEMASLYELRLCQNEIESLPDQLCTLYSLSLLQLGFNSLKALPEGFADLQSLQTLGVEYNKLESIPEGVFALEGLMQLILTGNKALGDASLALVSKVSSLEKLYAAEIGLTKFPEEIEALNNLERLDLAENAIEEIPEGVGQLQVLERLCLQNNKVVTLPDIFENMFGLIEINLTGNPLDSAIPDSFAALRERNVDILLDDTPLNGYVKSHLMAREEFSHPHRFRLGHGDMIGLRPTMEDAFGVVSPYMGSPHRDFFALYDGHAGRVAALFSGQKHPNILAECLGFPAVGEGETSKRESLESKQIELAEDVASKISKSFFELNDKLEAHGKETGDHSVNTQGCTGVFCFIDADWKCYIANVGDSRAVLCSGGKAIRLSRDHKPSSEEEEVRIRELGGFVTADGKSTSGGRVNGTLGVSRSIGDFFVHPFVSCQPYMASYQFGKEDEFLILACDGVWDEVDDQAAVDIVRQETNPYKASMKVRDFAYAMGSDDNISVMVAYFKKDEEINKKGDESTSDEGNSGSGQ